MKYDWKPSQLVCGMTLMRSIVHVGRTKPVWAVGPRRPSSEREKSGRVLAGVVPNKTYTSRLLDY